MIFRGRYRYNKGAYRPFITLYVSSNEGEWKKQSFLIDSGADETFLHSRSIRLLGMDTSALQIRDDASGIGGTSIPYIQHSIKLRLETPDGEFKIFGGPVNIFLDPHATRMPVLGRDVLDHFTVIFDRKRNSILLLDEPDDYQLVR
jgi:hypothetical protein